MSAPEYVLHPRWSSIDAILAAHRDGGLRIDLGCGYVKPEGFIGLDDLSGEGAQISDEDNAPDILTDLNHRPLPFPDASVTEVRSSHFLEHSVLDHIFDESHRVLVPGGIFLFAVPYANSAEGMFPGHQIFLTEKFFEQNLNFQSKFEIAEARWYPSDDWWQLPRAVRRLLPFDLARKHLFNVCRQMIVIAHRRPD